MPNDPHLRCLVCDRTAEPPLEPNPRRVSAATALSCFHHAVSAPFQWIFVSFWGITPAERRTALELCTLLKQNPHSKHATVCAVLPGIHRELLHCLESAKVDRVVFRPVAEALRELWSGASTGEGRPVGSPPGEILAVVCPYFNALPSTGSHDVHVCGGYRNRMVLTPWRIRTYCEVENHRECEWYRNPAKPTDGTGDVR